MRTISAAAGAAGADGGGGGTVCVDDGVTHWHARARKQDFDRAGDAAEGGRDGRARADGGGG